MSEAGPALPAPPPLVSNYDRINAPRPMPPPHSAPPPCPRDLGAMGAVLLERPAFASGPHYADRGKRPWGTAVAHAPEVIRRLTGLRWPRAPLINANCPAVPPGEVAGIAATRQGRRKIGEGVVERVDPRGRPYYWIGPMREEWPDIPGTDLHAVTTRQGSKTPICLDLTNGPPLAELKQVL